MVTLVKSMLALSLCLVSFCGYGKNHIVMMITDSTGAPMFKPNTLLIQTGDTIIWRTADRNISHNVVADANHIPKGTQPFESPLLDATGQEWSHRFSQEGTYHYHCHPHFDKGMTGRIIVGRASTPEELREPSSTEQSHHHH